MPKLQVCAVFDRAMQAFAQPMFVPAIGVATRGFTDECNRIDANNQLNKHPEDFELHYLGEYDDETGTFNQTERRLLARAQDTIQVRQ